jgi:nucleoid-associated protein YgaU
MSITNTVQLSDFQGRTLNAEKSADVISRKIRQKRIAEANRLFQKSASDMGKDDRKKISKQLSPLVEQAEKYFREAESLEAKRKLKQAREKYKKVEDIAIDYPELPQALRRLDDAIALVWALEHRAKRRTGRQDKQSVLLETSSQPGRLRGWFPLLACFSLLLIMVGAGLFYTDNLNRTFTEKDTVLQNEPHEKSEYFKANDTVILPINKKINQPLSQREQKDKITALKQQTQKNVLSQEKAGKPQVSQQESLSPLPASFLQMEKKIGDTISAEDEFTIRQDIQPTANIARKSAETIPEKSALLLQDHVAKTLTMNEREQPQQTPPVIIQQDESPVEIVSSRESYAETIYTVQPGDTLGSISLKAYGASSKWSAILNANKDQLANNPNGLQVGMMLVIPTLSEKANLLFSPGSSTSLADLNENGTYTVQTGDSLGNIAQKLFGNAWQWKKIYELNNDVLTAPHILKVGQILKVKASRSVKKTIKSSEPKPKEERGAIVTLWEDPSEYIDIQ